ncbi:MAG: DUF433 domain-containing protein [Thiomargarita sp.]|nr:DUF433 domain-containing protein [Thiomargarita sp.]
MNYYERIITDADVMLGKPVIKGTRITVELILRKLSDGMDLKVLLECYPRLVQEDVLAVLSYRVQQ